MLYSTTTEYAIQALLYLSISRSVEPIPVEEIAR